MIDTNNPFDVAVLAFIKTLYEQTGYKKSEIRRLLRPDVVEAIMLYLDENKR